MEAPYKHIGCSSSIGRGLTYRWMPVLLQIPQAARESCWRSKSGCGAGEYRQLLSETWKRGCSNLSDTQEMLNSTCHSRNTHRDATECGTTGTTELPPTAAVCAAPTSAPRCSCLRPSPSSVYLPCKTSS